MNHRQWINFKELRARLKFEDVLRHYKVAIRTNGEQHHGPCPLPGHTGSKSSPQFSANLKRGIFQCFGCGAKGNVLEFAGLMAGIDVKDGSALRNVAVELQTKFFPEGASTRTRDSEMHAPVAKLKTLPVVVNAPLDFSLKDLAETHPWLTGRGLDLETIRHFGLGFCSRGLLKNRVAIPLHDHSGNLVGYAGRVVDDSTVSKDNPRYCFPVRREHKGAILEFNLSLLLYNSHRIEAPADDLIIVEGFPSVWWLHQCGFPHVVGLAAEEVSDKQVELIASLLKPGGRVWILPNGDKEGSLLAQQLLRRVSPHRFVRWIKLGQEARPIDFEPDQLKKYFTS